MNMAEAKKKLMELANGGYHSLTYEVGDHGGGRVSQKCKVYLPDHGNFEAPHWEDAFTQLEASLSGRPVISESLPVSQKKDI